MIYFYNQITAGTYTISGTFQNFIYADEQGQIYSPEIPFETTLTVIDGRLNESMTYENSTTDYSVSVASSTGDTSNFENWWKAFNMDYKDGYWDNCGFTLSYYPDSDSGMNFETFINMYPGNVITSLWFDQEGGTWIPEGWTVVIDTGFEQIQLDNYNLPYYDNPLEFTTPTETVRFIWTQVSSWDSPTVFGIQFLWK